MCQRYRVGVSPYRLAVFIASILQLTQLVQAMDSMMPQITPNSTWELFQMTQQQQQRLPTAYLNGVLSLKGKLLTNTVPMQPSNNINVLPVSPQMGAMTQNFPNLIPDPALGMGLGTAMGPSLGMAQGIGPGLGQPIGQSMAIGQNMGNGLGICMNPLQPQVGSQVHVDPKELRQQLNQLEVELQKQDAELQKQDRQMASQVDTTLLQTLPQIPFAIQPQLRQPEVQIEPTPLLQPQLLLQSPGYNGLKSQLGNNLHDLIPSVSLAETQDTNKMRLMEQLATYFKQGKQCQQLQQQEPQSRAYNRQVSGPSLAELQPADRSAPNSSPNDQKATSNAPSDGRKVTSANFDDFTCTQSGEGPRGSKTNKCELMGATSPVPKVGASTAKTDTATTRTNSLTTPQSQSQAQSSTSTKMTPFTCNGTTASQAGQATSPSPPVIKSGSTLSLLYNIFNAKDKRPQSRVGRWAQTDIEPNLRVEAMATLLRYRNRHENHYKAMMVEEPMMQQHKQFIRPHKSGRRRLTKARQKMRNQRAAVHKMRMLQAKTRLWPLKGLKAPYSS